MTQSHQHVPNPDSFEDDGVVASCLGCDMRIRWSNEGAEDGAPRWVNAETLSAECPPWSPEKWRQRKASLEEDIRILEAQVAEINDMAEMLRERGIDKAALHAEAAVMEFDALLADMREKLEEANEHERRMDEEGM